jgi:hypothetical protein
MQNWSSMYDPLVEHAVHGMPALKQLAQMSTLAAIPGETMSLNSRQMTDV